MAEESIVLTVTGGAVRNGYILIPRKCESFFPADAFGGRKQYEPGRPITLHFAGRDKTVKTVETDIDFKRLVRLGRGELVKEFFREHGINEGGRFGVRRVGNREYRVEPVST